MHDSEEKTSGFKGRLPIVEDDCTPKGTCAKFHYPIVVTATLWWARVALPGTVNHPVFFYLAPTAVLAMVYGVGEGAVFAVAALICSAFFLYDPVYSFYVSSVHALGELFWFLVIALLGVKCLVELRRQSEKT